MSATLQQRRERLVQLGQICSLFAQKQAWPGFHCGFTEEEFNDFNTLIERHHHHNGWFTEDSIRLALKTWAFSLQALQVDEWISRYPRLNAEKKSKTVAIICAGNIPMVGLHDILSVYLSGHKPLVKLSGDDALLMPALFKMMGQLAPEFPTTIQYVVGKLTDYDAVIATGSNNTSRYFEYYFKSKPHIIRKNRTSIAVMSGEESEEELQLLGRDVFDHFGLGCRNVTKVYMPEGFDLNRVIGGLYEYREVINHNKYANNYDYNKAVWLLNQDDLLDNGFMLFKNDPALTCPTGSLFYEYYADRQSLLNQLAEQKDRIQCIVGKDHIPFGNAQSPRLWDYADGVDTLQFLINL